MTTRTKSFWLDRLSKEASCSSDQPRCGSGGNSNDPPPVGPNVDGAPMFVGEIKKDVAVVLGDADVNRPLGAVKLRPGFEQVEGRIQAICARCIPRRRVVLAPEPCAKAHAADRPSCAK